MSLLAAFADRPGAQDAALALIHFLWQGAAVAVLLAVANFGLRRASARARYAAACAALAVLCVLPAATFARLRVRERAAPPPALAARSVAVPLLGQPGAAHGASKASPDALAQAAPWIVAGWLAGVGVLSLRFIGGFVAARRLTRRHVAAADSAWQERFDRLAGRLGVPKVIRLLESAAVRVPTVVGVLRPAVLIPAGIATGMPASQLESLLAHELAHIRRRDALVGLLQAVAETLLFYHPAVWWASACIRVERENACDDLAVAATGDAKAHARALLQLAQRRSAIAPAFTAAADGGRLWNRIARLVAPGEAPRRPASGSSAVLVLGAILALGAAARVPTPDPAPPAASAPPVSPAPPAPPTSPATRAAQPSRPAPKPPEPVEARPARASSRGVLSPDDLVAFRIHGVTPEFIGEIAALGYARSTPDQLVALRIHGVTPEYAKAMIEIFGAGQVALDDLVAFRIHGVTPESARSQKAYFGQLSPDDAVALRIHGADAEFIQGFRDAGYAQLSADDAVALRIHGATPEFARALRAQGLSRLSSDDLVAFRIHGVTPEYVAAIRALGYDALDPDDLVAFRIHGVTPEWIRATNEHAGERLSPDDLVHRRIHARRWSTDEPPKEENTP